LPRQIAIFFRILLFFIENAKFFGDLKIFRFLLLTKKYEAGSFALTGVANPMDFPVPAYSEVVNEVKTIDMNWVGIMFRTG